MYVSPTTSPGFTSVPASTVDRGESAGGRAEGFGRMFMDQLQEVNGQQQQADQSVQQLLGGETDQVHDVILAVAKAELGFRFLIELRNQLTDTYQELMRMQV